MYLVDSDFDSDDEAFADDIEEVISNHIVNSIDSDQAAPIIEEEDIVIDKGDDEDEDAEPSDPAKQTTAVEE